MNKKKAYTQPDSNAADKFFSTSKQEETEEFTNNIDGNNVNKHTNVSNVTKHTNVSNKSKHYDERGKRSERCGILMDIQLKEDLRLLSNASGSKSVNDFIVTILLEYIENPISQNTLAQYKKLINK